MLRATRQFWTLVALAVLGAAPARAGMITVSNVDTNDIVIPVFDTSLGTLTGVQLQVTLLGGTTNTVADHDHATYQIVSSNTRNDPNVSGFSGSLTSSVDGGHTHTITTDNYSAGPIDLGNFSFTTDSVPGHSHTINVNFAGLQQVSPGVFRAVVSMDPLPAGSHTSAYSGDTKNFSYSGEDLAPFLSPSDIVISAGLAATSVAGTHNHIVPGFSVTVGSSTGPWTWIFGSSTLSTIGSHAHTYDPRFTTVATFFYEPNVQAVPEPASLTLCGIGAIGLTLIGAARRRRQTQTAA